MNYEIVSMVEPSEEYRYGVDHFQTYSYNDLFVWIVDYIKAARELQLALYDQTNIEIDPMTHISAIDLAKSPAFLFEEAKRLEICSQTFLPSYFPPLSARTCFLIL